MSARGRALSVWGLVVALVAAAAALTAGVVLGLPSAPLDAPLPWPVLLAAFLLAEACVVHVRLGKETYTSSLDEIPLVVGLFFVDPLTLIVVRLVGRAGVLGLHRRHPPVKLAFNLANGWLEAAVAVTFWYAVTASGDVLGPVGWAAAFGAVLVAELVADTSISAAIWLSSGVRQGRQSVVALGTGALMSAANVCLALVATAVVVVDWRASWTLVVLGALLFFAHRAYVVLRERHEALERLNRFTQTFSAEAEVAEVAHRVMLEVLELVAAGRAEIVLADELVMSCDAAGELVQHTDVGSSLGLGLRGRLLDHAVLAPRSTRDPVLRAWLLEAGLTDAVVVPLRVDDRVVGALTVADNRGGAGTFTSADRQVLEALGNHAAVAIENARLTQRLRGQVHEQHHQARHDALTGLPNRVHLHERMAEWIAADLGFAVLLLDLDRFKDVNDTLGHAAGDELLVAVAGRMRVLEEYGAFLSRLGGDEFVLLAPADDALAAWEVATLVEQVLSPTFLLGDLTVAVKASVGIALAPDDGREHSGLLRRADIAMYAAKQDGTGIATYSAGIDEHTTDRLALVAELRSAVAAGALSVCYQPKVDLAGGRISGVEALVRWSHPERGFVPPDEFIPMAEQTGLIREITSFVLDRALAQTAAWRAAGIDLGVAVNLSPRVLHSDTFETELAARLAEHGVPAGAVTLEVTEGTVMTDVEKTCRLLRRLRGLGVHLSIDDLGTGYSSLAYLKRLPVDEIKLDKSFVLGMADDADDAAIVRAMVQVGHQLRMTVVAEGVEDACTYEVLREMGCDVAQGYWMSRPLPAGEVADFVRLWERRALSATAV